MWDCDLFHKAVTDWLIETLDEADIKHARFAYDVGLTTQTDGKLLRNAKTGSRKWTMIDICKIANYFNEHPSYIIAKIEVYYEKNRDSIQKKIFQKALQDRIVKKK